jgi:hypothetical protein
MHNQHNHQIREMIHFLEFIERHREEFRMSQVQLSVSFTVNPGTQQNPLLVTPATATENLTVGVAADGMSVAVVSGGTAPYTYALDPSSGPLPDGVNFSEDGSGNVTLSGTPTTAGSSTTPVLLNINDAGGASASFRTSFATRKL